MCQIPKKFFSMSRFHLKDFCTRFSKQVLLFEICGFKRYIIESEVVNILVGHSVYMNTPSERISSHYTRYIHTLCTYTTKIAKPLLWSGVMSFAMDLRNIFSPQKRVLIYRTLFINWAWVWRRQKCGYNISWHAIYEKKVRYDSFLCRS